MSESYFISEQQYAPTIEYINKYFGTTDITETTIVRDDYIKNSDVDDVQTKLVWGRDGTTGKSGTKQNLFSLRDDISNQNIISSENNVEDLQSKFKIRRGLLEYTRNLLNASSGFLVDITKKIYKDIDANGNNKIVGFNGSPVWSRNNTKYAKTNFSSRTEGIRQHNAVDKYDKFTKAIRFDGNLVYGGNKDSVVSNSVLPKIHPVRNGNIIDNKNLMFSIENLAVLTVKDNEKNIGIINDEYGSQIPISEVGPFNGRIMWFPPYDLQLNETANSKFDAISMVGRNEPIYTYMNSERSTTLSFTLLVDYPQHLINYMGEKDYKREIAKFFTFGGDIITTDDNIVGIEKDIRETENKLDELKQTSIKNQEPPDFNAPTISFYFGNNLPRENEVNNIFDTMYAGGYEVIDGLLSRIDGSGSTGLNKEVYYYAGLEQITPNQYVLNILDGFSQYTATGTTNPSPLNTPCTLNDILSKFNNEDIKNYYGIYVESNTSKLGSTADNLKLSERRIAAVKKLISERLKIMFPDNNGFISDIFLSELPKGEKDADPNGNSIENINMPEVKENRNATITFAHNVKSASATEVTTDKQQEIADLQKKLDGLNLKLNKAKNKVDNIFEERTKESKAIFDTFEGIKGNYYQPAYHSQTPEDFHKRLTFLQQCIRQGSAKRFDLIDEDGVLRAKNSVFGRQPFSILRIGDFFHTKVIIENVTIDYNDTTWDMNPEGFGMQPMIAKVTLQMKVLGGQSLSGPIDALQNAATFNYYANSTFSDKGMYSRPSKVAADQAKYKEGVLAESIESMQDFIEKRNNINTQ
jgi:hypothetical protein